MSRYPWGSICADYGTEAAGCRASRHAKGTEEVTRNMGRVNAADAQTGAAASPVLSASGELGQQAETLRGDVASFLATIRAA